MGQPKLDTPESFTLAILDNMKKLLLKLIGLTGFCPSCLHWQGVFTFTDYVCLDCHENQKDGGGIKKILIGIIASILSFFGYGEYSEIKEQNLELQDKLGALEEQVNQPILGGVQDKDGDGVISKWEKDNGLPPLMNPKYWSPK